MQDQVQALNGLACGGVPTTYISSQQSQGEAQAVWLELQKPRPSIKLLYITPEQLVKGERLKRVLGCAPRRPPARVPAAARGSSTHACAVAPAAGSCTAAACWRAW